MWSYCDFWLRINLSISLFSLLIRLISLTRPTIVKLHTRQYICTIIRKQNKNVFSVIVLFYIHKRRMYLVLISQVQELCSPIPFIRAELHFFIVLSFCTCVGEIDILLLPLCTRKRELYSVLTCVNCIFLLILVFRTCMRELYILVILY